MMNTTDLPYGSGSVIYIERNTHHPYCARKYRESNSNGNPRYTIIGYYATYEEARQALAEAADRTGRDIENGNMTFRQVYEHYLVSHSDLSKNTFYSQKRAVERFCTHLFEMPYNEIRADDMRNVLANVTAKSMKKLVRNIFRQLDREADSLDIPGKRCAQYLPVIRSKKDDKRVERVPFTEAEMQSFLEHRDDRDMYLALFLCYTGFRQGAFRTILKKDVDMQKMTITGGIKTEAGRMRTIPIHPVIQPYVKRLMGRPGKYLLTNESGDVMSEAELNGRFQMAIAPYTDRHHVLHECRHTFRNKLDEARVDEAVICDLMGHVPPTAGQRYYSNVTLEKKRKAIMHLWSLGDEQE